jgi:hypothetical protein
MKVSPRALYLAVFVAAISVCGLLVGQNRDSSSRNPLSNVEPNDRREDPGCRRCTLASLNGCYGYSYTGSVDGVGPVAAVGPINFDGAGNTSATYSVNVNGTNFQGSFTGTYTVNRDCTGNVTINLPRLGISSNGRFVIVGHGLEAPFMGTDSGVTVTGVAKKL